MTSSSFSRTVTVLAVVLVLVGAYRLNHAIVQENVLGLFPTAREGRGLTAAAGGVSTRSLATTTTKTTDKGGSKGVGALIKELLNIRKQEPVDPAPPPAPPPPPPEEPDLSPEDPALPEEDPVEDEEAVLDLGEEFAGEEDVLEDEWYLDDYYYDETPVEDYTEETYLEEDYLYEEYLPTDPLPYDSGVYTEEAEYVPSPTAPRATPAPRKTAAPAPVTTKKLPDLFIGEVTPLLVPGATTVRANDPLGFNFRVDNAGSAVSAPFSTRVRIDAGTDGTWDAEKITASPTGLPINATQRLAASYILERTPGGRHLAEICVDTVALVPETNERNNCRRIEFAVSGSAAPAPAPAGTGVYQSVIKFLSGFLN